MSTADPLFDVPEDGPLFELPDEDAAPSAAEVLPVAGPPIIRELLITPDVEAYLTMLEAAIAPYEATAQQFARDMARLPIDTPQQLQLLGQQSLVAKDREKLLDDLFEPAIRKPRLYLDRVYALKRRVVSHVKAGGDTAARRYTQRKRELDEADRLARLEAERRDREARQAAERIAAAERQRLAEAATKAAQSGDAAAAATLIDQARAVEPEPVAVELPPPSQGAAAAVAGLGERHGWDGTITDMKVAILASARPDVMREIAAMVEGGDLTAGGTSITTQMIATKLRALATELPIIPSKLFAGDPTELKARAAADRDTLTWPGFAFTQTVTPVRRTSRKA